MTGEGMDGANQVGSLDDVGPAEETASQADNHSGANGSGTDVVLVTGLSGAGRSTAAKVLEDLGWYVADNLPPQLITRMVDLGLAAGSRITQLAVVMDVRSSRASRTYARAGTSLSENRPSAPTHAFQ